MSIASSHESSGRLTLKYGGAAATLLIALYNVTTVLSSLFGLWTDKASSLVSSGGYIGIVESSILAVMFALVAFLLYKNVTKEIAMQPEYINSAVYHFITNGLFAVLATVFIVCVTQLLSILISSLLLIGTSTDIGGLYLNQFLPSLLGAGVIGVTGFAAYKIMKGRNLSGLMTIVLVSLAGALLIATLITVPIKAHSTASVTPSNSSFDYSKYFNY